MNELPCIVCNRDLEPAISEDDETVNQPYGGTTFNATGQYGSTVFDPIDEPGPRRPYLEINVCDACIRELAPKGKILEIREKYVRKEFEVKLFEPPEPA